MQELHRHVAPQVLIVALVHGTNAAEFTLHGVLPRFALVVRAVEAATLGQSACKGYRRREPENDVLHRILRQHLESFLALVASDPTRSLPRFVEHELRAFLDCGVLQKGFARVSCESCRREIFVAFSCKGRGFCPSCGGRRMASTAAHLVDSVLPEVPVRQWVLSLPHDIRFALGYDPQLLAKVRRCFLRKLMSFLRRHAREALRVRNST